MLITGAWLNTLLLSSYHFTKLPASGVAVKAMGGACMQKAVVSAFSTAGTGFTMSSSVARLPPQGFCAGLVGVTSIGMVTLVVPELVKNKLMAASGSFTVPEVTPETPGGNSPSTDHAYTVFTTVDVGLKIAVSPEQTVFDKTGKLMTGLSAISTVVPVVKPGQGGEGTIV